MHCTLSDTGPGIGRAAVLPARAIRATASQSAAPAYEFALKAEVSHPYKRGRTLSSQEAHFKSSSATIGTGQPLIRSFEETYTTH